jgi:protein-S-isoprenylcysteine O-methyltransferase Ste14
MSDDLIFRLLVLVLFGAFVVHRGYYSRRASRAGMPADAQPEQGFAARAAIVLNIAALVVTLLYAINPQWLEWGALAFPGWVRWGGVGIAALGFGLLQWAQQTLGSNWSDTPRLLPGQQLVTAGPYRWVRHPIYTAFLLIMCAPLLLSANWIVGGLWLGSTALAVWGRVKVEEALMLAQFGDRYREYKRATGSLVPFI